VKTLFVLLLAANIAFFAVKEGYLGPLITDGREPSRLVAQISPEKMRVLPPDLQKSSREPAIVAAAAPPKASTVACLEFGGFAGDDAKRVEAQLDALGVGAQLTVRKSEEPASYLVYLPPFKTKADADHAAQELKRIGVNDFFVIQDNGPFKLAISLGVFHSMEAAKAQLTALSQLGVKNAKTTERTATVTKNYYQLRNVAPELAAQLTALRASYPNQDLHECAPNAPDAVVSSSGT